MKLKCMIRITNVHFISVKTTNSAVWSYKGSLTLFWVFYQTKQCFHLTNGSTSVSSRHETVGALQQNIRAIFSSSWEQSKSKQRLAGSLAFAFSTLFEYKNQVFKNSLQHCCHKSKPLFFQQMDYLMKLKCMMLTTNVLSVSVKTRKCAVWNSKSLPTLFHVSYQSNQLFNWLERSTNMSSKLETVEALKQNAEDAPKESMPAFLFSNMQLFLGLFQISPLSFHIKAPQKKRAYLEL